MGKRKNKTESNPRLTIATSVSKPSTKKTNKSAHYTKRLKNLVEKQKLESIAGVQQSQSLPSTGKNKKIKNSVADDARERLESAHFRYLNEKLYTSSSFEALKLFQEEPQSYDIYHKGFKNQVVKWPVNPLDLIIKDLLKGPSNWVVGDFGCGEARLAQSIPNQVHSFDLVAANDRVIACDMAHTSLASKTLDVVVFCLSLMGLNLIDFLKEANRVLKVGGILYVAEVESRCQNVQYFLKAVEQFGFKLNENQAHKCFFLAKFRKIKNLSPKATIPRIKLKPCLYKKR